MNPPAVSIYCDRFQEKMAQAFQSDSYFGLISAIKEAEAARAPNPGTSRITTALTPRWEKTACFLLLQVDVQVLHAILDNTLPHRALNDLRNAVRTVARTTAASVVEGDPAIYINWLADKDGHGLTIAEFEEFLDALEVIIRMKPDKVSPSRQGSNLTIRAGLQDAFRKAGGTGELVTQANAPGLRNSALPFVTANRNIVVPRAKTKGNNEIMLRGEVGWSVDFVGRAAQHKGMSVLSPLLFRVANCLLRYLFPDRDFDMFQYAIFEITDPSEAPVGESILSHIAASYVGYGGFNTAQAGVQISSAYSTSINWRQITIQAIDNGYFVKFPQNSQRLSNFFDAKKEHNRRALEWHRNREEFLIAMRETDQVLEDLDRTDRELADLLVDVKQKLEQLRHARETAQAKASKNERGIKAMRELLAGLAVAGEEDE